MKARWILMAAVAAGLCGCCHSHKHHEEGEEGQEMKMTLEQVPGPVRAGLQREAGDAKIGMVDKEMRDGKTVYETDVKSAGKTWEIRVDENGKLISRKVEGAEDEKDEKEEKDEKDKG